MANFVDDRVNDGILRALSANYFNAWSSRIRTPLSAMFSNALTAVDGYSQCRCQVIYRRTRRRLRGIKFLCIGYIDGNAEDQGNIYSGTFLIDSTKDDTTKTLNSLPPFGRS